jgi:hypothetical protein
MDRVKKHWQKATERREGGRLHRALFHFEFVNKVLLEMKAAGAMAYMYTLFVCMCIHIFTCIYMYIYIYIHVYIYMYECIYII